MNKNQTLEQKYQGARMNLLLMLILTVVNIVLFFTGAETMLLFSATIPFYAVAFGSVFMPAGIGIALYVLAGLVVIAYFLCWLLSKKRYGWVIVALVMFAIDTLALVGLSIWIGDFSGILDALIHALVLYYLIVGVSSGCKLKNMPVEEEEAPVEEENTPVEEENAAADESANADTEHCAE